MLFAAERDPQELLPFDPTARAHSYERYFHVFTDIIGPSHAAFRLGIGEGRALLERLAIDGVVALEQVLTHAPYLAGPNFSIADIAGFTITQALVARLDVAALPRITAWLARIGALPEVRRGLAAFG
jgi:GST-like protein